MALSLSKDARQKILGMLEDLATVWQELESTRHNGEPSSMHMLGSSGILE